jgi:hypothetical protein
MEEDKLHRRRTLGKTGGFPVAWPNVSVFDPDGNLPLVLQRNGLATSQYPFNQWLFEDVIRDWLAFLLVNAPGRPFDGEILPTEYGRSYPGFPRDLYSTWQDTSSTLFCSAIDGIYPADSWHIRQGNFHRFLLTTKLIPPEAATASLHSQTGCDLIVPVPSPTGVQKYRQWNRFALCGSPDSSFGYLKEFDVTCRRMLLSRAEYKEISRGTIIAKYLWENVSEECSNDKWVVVRTGSCDCGDQCDLLALSDIVPEGTYGAPVMIEWHLASSQPPQEKLTPLARLWKDILPSPVIPYDPAERRQSFSEAFTKLKDYIAAHEQSLMGEREKKQDSSA